jgi:hypothetical protein
MRLLTEAVGSARRRKIGDLHVCFVAHSGRCGLRRLIGSERVEGGKLHVLLLSSVFVLAVDCLCANVKVLLAV